MLCTEEIHYGLTLCDSLAELAVYQRQTKFVMEPAMGSQTPPPPSPITNTHPPPLIASKTQPPLKENARPPPSTATTTTTYSNHTQTLPIAENIFSADLDQVLNKMFLHHALGTYYI